VIHHHRSEYLVFERAQLKELAWRFLVAGVARRRRAWSRHWVDTGGAGGDAERMSLSMVPTKPVTTHRDPMSVMVVSGSEMHHVQLPRAIALEEKNWRYPGRREPHEQRNRGSCSHEGPEVGGGPR